MSVAVAHHTRSSSALALAEGARQAAYRGTDLVVIHVVESLDQDIAEANKAGISDAVEAALKATSLPDLRCDVRLVAGGSEISQVSEALLGAVKELEPELLVIGARRRSPMGKAFLGSVAQNIILDADVPVLVVKSPR
ncbi:universal stress protein family protein [Humibacillus xanthopallidus]|uniref:Universal stress protein family protein n=1 Tax=Humibacillus xanthopallidus TaxID=412689 RepID=A0A543PLC7_9MICO|nr:universal stress protein [Humibacillus xanthopallidus]TQN44882.1 universal stress protein family protein [Humibacillus xanthopallidus]